MGLEKAGFEMVALNEIMHDACETLRQNRPDWNVIEGDISSIDFSRFQDIDLLSGGFPCQAFSYAGNRFGFEDTRGTLFFEFARAIREMQPKVFLGENVRGLLTHDNGNTLKVIKATIQELGYTLIEPQILKAIFYRVPQKRERLALVGIRNDLAKYVSDFHWPSPAQRVYTVRDAFKKGDLFPCDVPDSPGVSYSSWKAEIIEQIPTGGYWRDLPVDLQKKLLKGSFHLEGGKTGIGRRLSWDEPSLTLTCAPAQNQTGRCHPEATRPLTIREYARIQTFPDEWAFYGSSMSQYKQIGNAVPVNLAQSIGQSLVRLLNAMDQDLPETENRKTGEFTKGIQYADGSVQLLLFENKKAYIPDEAPIVLLGSSSKTQIQWILANNYYSSPVSMDEPNFPTIRKAAIHLCLKAQQTEAFYFRVDRIELVDIQTLQRLNYPLSKKEKNARFFLLFCISRMQSVQVESFPNSLNRAIDQST